MHHKCIDKETSDGKKESKTTKVKPILPQHESILNATFYFRQQMSHVTLNKALVFTGSSKELFNH